MKKLFSVLVLAVLLVLTPAATPLGATQLDSRPNVQPDSQTRPKPTPPSFFGMMTHNIKPSWPQFEFRGIRLWGTATTWAELNPSDGVYNWTRLDSWLTQIPQYGEHSILFTLAMTPQWASSSPNDQECHNGPGACDPPNDLNSDGSGTDQHWKDFVTAIATHANGQIRYWEIWNEPAMALYWKGTFPQMMRLAQDARTIILSIDPNALILSPPNGADELYVQHWWEKYAAIGGLQYADIIALHGGVNLPPRTCGHYPEAANFITQVNNLRSILAQYNVQNKEIWDTESNWGKVSQNCFKDPDLQAAFLAQFYMFHRSMGIHRFYWYAYDDGDTGTLSDLKTGTLNKGGVAFVQVRQWMLGNTMVQNCSTSDNAVWTCGFTGPGGYLAQAIWDTSETCSDGQCQTVNYTVDPTYTQYRTLDGQTVPITNNQVPIGAKPILLENQTPGTGSQVVPEP